MRPFRLPHNLQLIFWTILKHGLACLVLLVIQLVDQACFGQKQPNFRALWKAQLATGHGPIEFNLVIIFRDFKPDSGYVSNGAENIEIKVSPTGENRFRIEFPHYDSAIDAEFSDERRSISGAWKKVRADDNIAEMDFSAQKMGLETYRDWLDSFESPADFLGRWQVHFEGDEELAVADFKRENEDSNRVIGTFLTTTGDYRYLGGYVKNGQLRLSCFDGAHAFLFHAKVDEQGQLQGKFFSGNWYEQNWTATKNPDAKLTDATTLTKVTDNIRLEDMNFPGLDGELVNLNELIKGQPAIIELFGSWCPNCHDAAAYLDQLSGSQENLAIVGLAFELTSDNQRNIRQVKRYVEKYEVEYPVLIAGPADKTKATEKFKLLDRIRSYPTFIFVDGEGDIRGVYQGFSGPATGEDFEKLKATFASMIDVIKNK